MIEFIQNTTDWLQKHWRGVISTFLITILATVTLGLQINTLSDGQNKYETAMAAELQEAPSAWGRMVNAPYTIPTYLLTQISNNPITSGRIVSVIYGLLATAALFFILKRWLNVKMAAIGTLIFFTSSWVMAVSHQAAPFILLVIAPLAILLGYSEFVNSKQRHYPKFLLLVATLAFAAYIPYMFWSVGVMFVILLFIYKQDIIDLYKWQLFTGFLLYALLLLPLILSISQYPGQLRELAGIPFELPSVMEYITHFGMQISTLLFISQPFPALYVGSLPVLDIFIGTMLLLGVYHFVKHVHKRRKLSFLLICASLLLIIPLHQDYQIPLTALIPFVFIISASGIHEFMNQWFSYFPRNPFARNSAVIVIAVLIGISTLYNLQKFYIAWPNSPETKAAYMIQSKEEK